MESTDYAVKDVSKAEDEIGVGPGLHTQSVSLNRLTDALEINFEWIPECGKPPRRSWTLGVAPGTWVRIRYNGRFVSHENPWYEDKVLNIAFEMVPWREMFESATPAQVVDIRADLK